MKFPERTFLLKDGRTCTLCPTYSEYAADMIEYLKIIAAETPFLFRNPDEVTYTLERERKMGYKQIELEVVEGNDTAKRLYEKCGFVENGKHVRALKYDDGTYRDEFIMVKVL